MARKKVRRSKKGNDSPPYALIIIISIVIVGILIAWWRASTAPEEPGTTAGIVVDFNGQNMLGTAFIVETDTGKTPVLHPPRHTPGQQAPHRPDDSPLKSEAPTKSQIARLNSADQPLPTVRAAPCAQTTLTGGMRAGLHWSLRVLTSSHSTLAAAIAS